MNIRLFQQQNDTLLSIEADFDNFVAENFGDICKALAKYVNTLSELQNLHYQNVQIEDVIAIIRSSHDKENAKERISQKYNISATASLFILRTSINDLDKILDCRYLDQEIEQCMGVVQSLILPLFSY